MNSKLTALITGASRGIGREIALEFSRAGYSIILNYKNEKAKAESVAEEIKNAGGDAFVFQADIADSSSVKNLINNIVKTKNHIDVLINNAGICRDRTILKMSLQEWKEVIDTNLSGSFYVLQECAKIMVKQKSGSIINIASITGCRGSIGNANYTSSKAGLLALTKSAARELGRFNIRVNAILPGFHLTDMGQSAPLNYQEKISQESVLGLTTDIKELSKFVVFLAGMKTISGQIFNCDSRII